MTATTVTGRSHQGPGTPGPTRNDRLDAAHDLLMNGLAQLTTSDAWTRMLTVANQLHRYSWSNICLLAAQDPEATMVMGYRAWQSVGRQVVRGARALKVIAPVTRKIADETSGETEKRVVAFTVANVFDIRNTTGEDIPDVRPALPEGDAPEHLWDGLAAQITAAGFDLVRGHCGTANGLTNWATRTVTIRADISPIAAAKVAAHELAHCLLHAPDHEHERPCRGVLEVEAESVAWLILNAHGLCSDTYSFAYVTTWADGDLDVIASTAQRVITCARLILGTLNT